MSRSFRVHPEVVESDLADAVSYYRDIDEALPGRLVEEYEAGLRRIAAHPTLLAEYQPGWRRVLLARFPYLLAFVVSEETIHVVGLFHTRREPAMMAGAVRDRR